MARLLFLVAPATASSGNATTAERLLQYFGEGWRAVLLDANEETAALVTRRERVEGEAGRKADVVVLLHAWRAGRHLERVFPSHRRAVLILGGTDANEMVTDPEREAVMSRAVRLSSSVICFSQDLLERSVAQWGSRSKHRLIAQAAVSFSSRCPRAASQALDSLLSQCGVVPSPAARLFIAPMGIRPVKDPLFAAQCFPSDVHAHHPEAYLLIIGPTLDKSLALDVKGAGAGVLYHEGVPRSMLHDAMSDPRVAGVVNCSVSEGQPQAVMEAMLCGAPVLLRDIPGNRAVAVHCETATFFSSPASFATACIKHLTDPSYAVSLASSARAHAEQAFSLDKEKCAYLSLLQDLLAHPYEE